MPAALDEIGAKKVLVVTDEGIIKAGLYDKIEKILKDAGIEVSLCDRVAPDPAITLVESIAEEAKKDGPDAIIGLGGGSSIDTAKTAAALLNNPKELEEYIGTDLLEADCVPMIAVPTTAGTGSEATHITILSDEAAGLKKGLVSVRMMPRYAFLDPSLTLGLPGKVTASTGMDAICHALESFTSINANDYTESLSLRALKLLTENIEIVYLRGTDADAREKMLLGSLLAGIAFANAGVTAVHAFAYPLGGMFHVPHGLANSVMLPTIVKFNAVGNEERFAAVGRAVTGNLDADADDAVTKIEELFDKLELPRNLQALDIPETAIEPMAEGAIQITRLLNNNPRKITLEDAKAIYREAYNR
jgi:alcohol dehydrogenase class IV